MPALPQINMHQWHIWAHSLYNMLIVTLMAILGFGKIVIAQGMRGAVKYYMVIMFLLALLNFCCTMIVEYKRKNKYQP